MVEGQRREDDGHGRVGGEEVVERDGAIGERAARAVRRVGHDDHLAHRRQVGGHLGQLAGHVVALPAVSVAIGGEQHRRLDLPEAVEDAAGAEVGGGRREHGADRGGGQHHGVGLGQVREPGGHPVALSDACAQQGLLEPGDEGVQVGPGQVPGGAVLAAEQQRRLVVVAVEQVLGVVEDGVGEEAGVGEVVAGRESRAATGFADDFAPVPGKAPEAVWLSDRPVVQVQCADAGMCGEGRHLRAGGAFGRRGPEGGDHRLRA